MVRYPDKLPFLRLLQDAYAAQGQGLPAFSATGLEAVAQVLEGLPSVAPLQGFDSVVDRHQRRTSVPLGLMPRKAMDLFNSAIEDFKAGRVVAAHNKAVLASAYDPKDAVYRDGVETLSRLRQDAAA